MTEEIEEIEVIEETEVTDEVEKAEIMFGEKSQVIEEKDAIETETMEEEVNEEAEEIMLEMREEDDIERADSALKKLQEVKENLCPRKNSHQFSWTSKLMERDLVLSTSFYTSR